MSENISNSNQLLLNKVSESFKKGNLLLKPAEMMQVLRKEMLSRPVIYIGAGTCGLGAGAVKTLEATQQYLFKNHIDAEIIEVGCIGLCSSEPLLDVQLPGYNRISFQHVTHNKVESTLDSVFQLELPKNTEVLCQFKNGESRQWDNVPFISEHPFFAPQTRLVLKNCGIINPISIEEYIATGGYTNYLEIISTKNHSKFAT